MTLDFYYMDISPPCRAVMLTAKAVGVTLNKKVTDLFKAKDHLKPEFLAMNPQHTIPLLVDGDLKLWESRVICTYLINQYAKTDCLYSKDPKTRAMIDRFLYFDMGTLFKRFGNYFRPVAFQGAKPDPELLASTHEALGWFNDFLKGQDFCVGSHITVADLCLIATVSSIIEAGLDMSKYPNITSWVERCKSQMPGYETENGVGVQQFGAFIKPILNSA